MSRLSPRSRIGGRPCDSGRHFGGSFFYSSGTHDCRTSSESIHDHSLDGRRGRRTPHPRSGRARRDRLHGVQSRCDTGHCGAAPRPRRRCVTVVVHRRPTTARRPCQQHRLVPGDGERAAEVRPAGTRCVRRSPRPIRPRRRVPGSVAGWLSRCAGRPSGRADGGGFSPRSERRFSRLRCWPSECPCFARAACPRPRSRSARRLPRRQPRRSARPPASW